MDAGLDLQQKIIEAGQELTLNMELVERVLMEAGTPNAKQLANDLIASLDVFVNTVTDGLILIRKNLDERNN